MARKVRPRAREMRLLLKRWSPTSDYVCKWNKSIMTSRSPSERVLTVCGSLADFIIAVKVMISVRSNRLHPVQRPFINRIKCFWKETANNKSLNLKKNKPAQFTRPSKTKYSWVIAGFLPARRHMLHLDFQAAAMRIQSILYMLRLLTAPDFEGLITKKRC